MSMAEAVELIRSGSRFLVTCHRRADGDALGSALGLAAVLRAAGKEAVVYHPEPVPRSLRFIPGADAVVDGLGDGERFDASFITDTAAAVLVPEPMPPREVRGPLVVVDHHAASEPFGDVVLCDTTAVATGEVVIRLMRELGVDVVPPEAATPLYASLVADTGGFRYPGTGPEVLRLGADLLEAGADPWEVAYNLFEGWPIQKVALLRRILDTFERHHDGRLAMLTVTRRMIADTGADDEMVEGLGLWGVPSFRLSGPDGEPDLAVWGQDRLWLVAAEIRRRAS